MKVLKTVSLDMRAMSGFKERNACLSSNSSDRLIGRRYRVQEKLARGGFGTVYLVQDTRAEEGESFKVLKEIPLGDLKPNDTVQASMEAQLLSQLNHPTIVKFYSSFVEDNAFCIITEYCEDKDMHYRLSQFRATGETLSESQVTEWLVQLLLGVHYIHERRILHRDLKTKNIFLKKNLVKIGDFGVSRFLMGSCDLATTFTGTPYYMSPEALTHQGYDSKSDIWSLGCILYEMCCLDHAFNGDSFVSVVRRIVEGPIPTLPQMYSTELNAILQRMLSKEPQSRPSAAEALKIKFIEGNLHSIKSKLSDATIREQNFQQDGHSSKPLSTQCLAEKKPEENSKQMQELHIQHFDRDSTEVMSVYPTCAIAEQRDQSPRKPEIAEIPAGRHTADAYYRREQFEFCSDEEREEEEILDGTSRQDSDAEAMIKCMENVLENASETVFGSDWTDVTGHPTINRTMAEGRVQQMKESIREKMGTEVFHTVYGYLKKAKAQGESEANIHSLLGSMVDTPSDCFEVDMLLYYEEQLLRLQEDTNETLTELK